MRQPDGQFFSPGQLFICAPFLPRDDASSSMQASASGQVSANDTATADDVSPSVGPLSGSPVLEDIARVLEHKLGVSPGRNCVVGEGLATVELGLFLEGKQVRASEWNVIMQEFVAPWVAQRQYRIAQCWKLSISLPSLHQRLQSKLKRMGHPAPLAQQGRPPPPRRPQNALRRTRPAVASCSPLGGPLRQSQSPSGRPRPEMTTPRSTLSLMLLTRRWAGERRLRGGTITTRAAAAHTD